MSAVANAGAPKLTAEQITAFIVEPLKQLPLEFRLPTWDFWSFFSHLLPDQLALASRIRFWIAEDGLELAELTAAFTAMRKLRTAGEFQFASQVLGGLAEAIELIRKKERDEKRKKETIIVPNTPSVAMGVPAELATGLAERFRSGPK